MKQFLQKQTSTASVNMMQVLGVFVAALAYFALGWLWYAPFAFGRRWAKLAGVPTNHIEKLQKSSKFKVPLYTFFSCLLVSATLCSLADQFGLKGAMMGFFFGCTLAIGLVAPTQLPSYLYVQKPMKLYLIEAGYNVAGVLVASIIISLFHGIS